MKNNFVFILTYCILVLSFIGCGTSRLFSIEEGKEKTVDNDYLILHTPVEKYKLTDYAFTENKLVGKLGRLDKYRGFNIHVYIHYLSVGNLDNNPGMYVEIKESKIKKIIYKKEMLGLKMLGVAGGVFGLIIVYTIFNFDLNLDLF